jgi:hypothetical protein
MRTLNALIVATALATASDRNTLLLADGCADMIMFLLFLPRSQ